MKHPLLHKGYARSRMRGHAIAAIAASLILSGCEGLFTGTRESKQPLTQAEDGSFAVIKLRLAPDMNPVALNIQGSTIASKVESGLYNSYRAALSLNGERIATGTFHINNTGPGGPFRQTMLYASVTRAGEHELSIVPAKPKEITIEQPMLEVRRNTQPPPR